MFALARVGVLRKGRCRPIGRPYAQCTVVTETRGDLEGHRVVRGREGDCIAHYAASGKGQAPEAEADLDNFGKDYSGSRFYSSC